MKKEIKTLIYLLKQIYAFDKGYLPLVGLRILLQLLITLFFVLFPSYVLWIIQSNYEVKQIVVRIVSILIIYFIVNQLFISLQQRILIQSEILDTKFSKQISKNTMTLKFESVENPMFQTMKDESMYAISDRKSMLNILQWIPDFVIAAVTFILMIGLISQFDLWYLFIVIGVTLLNVAVSQYFMKLEQKAVKNDLRQNKEYVYYLRLLNDSAIAKDVRVYQQQPFFIQRVHKLFSKYIQSGKELYGAQDLRAGINKMISIGLSIISYGYLLVLILNGKLQPEEFLMMLNASITFTEQIYIMVDIYLIVEKELMYLTCYKDYVEACEQSEFSGTYVLSQPITSICFEDVYFKYPSLDENVLNGVSFHIDGAKSLSIVGENGSGKTTLIKLLSRLYEPSSGRILVNGIDIQTIEYQSYLKALSIIFQDFMTFNFTIEENIILQQNMDQNKFNFALKQSDLEIELDKFNYGVNTVVGKRFDDDGVELSKGQQQKLAIARSVYRNASLMILDEPTASLDPLAEEKVYEHFRKITEDKLSIFISHRLSSCRFSDVIIYLKDGQVQETGTHNELIDQRGGYANMFELQASKYK